MNPKSGHGSFTPTDTCRRHGTGPETNVRKCTFGNAAEFPEEYNPKVVERLHLVATVVSLASELLHDADWFLAGDTGKEDMLIDTDATLANLRTILEAHGE